VWYARWILFFSFFETGGQKANANELSAMLGGFVLYSNEINFRFREAKRLNETEGRVTPRGRANSLCKSISTLPQKGRLSKCALKGSKQASNFFRVALPHRYLAYWLFNSKNRQEYFQKCSWFSKVTRFTDTQVDEVPECGRSKSNAHPGG
jgi:hypothetical protein